MLLLQFYYIKEEKGHKNGPYFMHLKSFTFYCFSIVLYSSGTLFIVMQSVVQLCFLVDCTAGWVGAFLPLFLCLKDVDCCRHVGSRKRPSQQEQRNK